MLLSFIENTKKSIANFDEIYNVVKEYNSDYTGYVDFVKVLLEMKLKELKRFE